jgi:hypothetical protein
MYTYRSSKKAEIDNLNSKTFMTNTPEPRFHRKTPTLVYQIIPERHVQAFLNNGYYFAPCRDFKDKDEFRYGYCLFNVGSESEIELQRALDRTWSIPEVNEWLATTGVSCWTRNLTNEDRMWKEYGGNGPAIRISVDVDSFLKHVRSEAGQIAAGNVTYEGMIPATYSPFLTAWELGEAPEAIYHLFFHKRGRFEWEQEFRVVLFLEQGRTIGLKPEMIYSVEVSPLGELSPSLRSKLRDMFGDRLIESEADRRAFKSRYSGEIDETITNDKLRPMLEEWRRLKTLAALDRGDWNDPKSSKPMEPVLEMTRKIKELERAILAEQAPIKESTSAPRSP